MRQRSASVVTHIATSFVLMWHPDGIKGETLNSPLRGKPWKHHQASPAESEFHFTNHRRQDQNAKRGHATWLYEVICRVSTNCQADGELSGGNKEQKTLLILAAFDCIFYVTKCFEHLTFIRLVKWFLLFWPKIQNPSIVSHRYKTRHVLLCFNPHPLSELIRVISG